MPCSTPAAVSVLAMLAVAAACGAGGGARTHANPPATLRLVACDSTPVRPPLFSQHRTAWRARHITDYRLVVAAGCFCPWPGTPAILDVRGGIIAQLLDTLGNRAGAPREPWSLYTVDGLFAAVAEGLRRDDVIEVGYDACYDFPATISGDAKVGQVDDWFWIKASRLTPSR